MINKSKGWISSAFVPSLVSVIIPTHNREQFLGEAIQSVVDQTYAHWECIVIDDASTDGTRALVDSFAQTLSPRKVRYLSQEHQGAQVARNNGIQKSRGEFIQYLDSDDLLGPEKLTAQVNALARSGAGIVYGPWRKFRDTARGRKFSVVYCQKNVPGGDFLSALMRGWNTICSYLYRREAVEKIGAWDEELIQNQDVDYAFRAGLAGYCPEFCSKGLALRRAHSGNRLSGLTNAQTIKSRQQVLDKIESALASQGLSGRYRRDLACLYALRAMEISEMSGADCAKAEAWLRRSKELGPASVPCDRWLGLAWRLLGPLAIGRLRRLVRPVYRTIRRVVVG